MVVWYLVLSAVFLLFLLDWNKRRYWNKYNVLNTPSVPLFGHLLPVTMLQETLTQVYHRLYHACGDKPYIGLYEFWRPVLIIKDRDLAESILIKDVSSFLNHPRWLLDDKTFMNASLFNLKGNLWRAMRYAMTPAFTFKRMKTLFPSLLAVTSEPEEGELDAFAYFRRATEDTITTFLGVKIDKETIAKMSRGMNDVSTPRFYEMFIAEHFPSISERIGFKFVSTATDNSVKYLEKIVSDHGENDFSKLLQKIQSQGQIHLKSKDLYANSDSDEIYSFDVTDNLIHSQAGNFLIAGLDVNGNTVVWMAYEMARSTEIQRKAREEIRRVLKEHGEWSYLAVQDMKYLGQCALETLRLHPVLAYIFRDCTTTYTTTDGLTIEKGTKVVVPAYSVHLDPRYFADPEIFRPERFGPDEQIHKCTYLPFGEGPRKCMGMRFALSVIKLIIARIVENHEMTVSEKTMQPLKTDIRTFVGTPEYNIYLKLRRVP